MVVVVACQFRPLLSKFSGDAPTVHYQESDFTKCLLQNATYPAAQGPAITPARQYLPLGHGAQGSFVFESALITL